jgi:hypothetical protein
MKTHLVNLDGFGHGKPQVKFKWDNVRLNLTW